MALRSGMREEKICHFNNKHLKITAEWRRWCDVDVNTHSAAEIGYRETMKGVIEEGK